jgi:integrase/recombinase XerD
MATIAIVLETTQKLSNGEYGVALRVTHDRQSKCLSISKLITNQSLKFRCTPEHLKPLKQKIPV